MVDYRPALHLTAKSTWINDPNGPVWHAGRAHVFFQNNPFGADWGNMSWGHASSVDFVNWTHHPVAIPCDDHEQVFSGCVVVDSANSSGLGSPGSAPLVAIYTSDFLQPDEHGREAQSLAFSEDGESWQKYAGNPVLARGSDDFRDPKVFKDSRDGVDRWVMVAVEAARNQVVFYASPDLINWSYLSSFGPAHALSSGWECPDLFPLPVEDSPGEVAWVLLVSLNPGGIAGGSGTQYFVGEFDGVTFRPFAQLPEGSPLEDYDWLDHGSDYYAATTWYGLPDGRRISIAWMNNWDYARQTPTAPWRSALSLPRELNLVRRHGRLVLRQRVPQEVTADWTIGTPVPVLTSSRVREEHEAAGEFMVGRCAVGRVVVDLEPGTSTSCGITVLGGLRIGYSDGRIFVDRRDFGHVDFAPGFSSISSARCDLVEGRLRLEVYVDRCSVEVFAAGGEVTVTELAFPVVDVPDVTAFVTGGDAEGSVRIDTPSLGPRASAITFH